MDKHTTSQGPGLTRSSATPDLTGYRDLHRALLTSANGLVEALSACRPGDARRARALSRWFTGYRGELQHHHHVEDDIFFAALDHSVPSFSEYSAGIDDDHVALERLIEQAAYAIGALAADPRPPSQCHGAAISATVELRDRLTVHLTLEDDDILPMFERHFSVAEYAHLEREALRGVSLRQAWFTVPWYMATVDRRTALSTWADAPAAMKIVHALSHRSYERLARQAFGGRS